MTRLQKLMLEELQRRNYSQTTVTSYIKIVAAFAKYFQRPPDQLGPEEIRQYQLYLLNERKQGIRTVGAQTAALRFFFCKTLKRHYPVEKVPYPRAARKLPVILTQEEAVRLIDSASNLFHRTMLMTLYSTGMRRAELCPPPSGRYRQRTHDHPYPARQAEPRSRCAAQSKAARHSS